MTIKMARGDIFHKSFIVRDANHQPVTYLFDEIYMTCKSTFNNSRALFQKTLSGGTIMKEADDGKYSFTIEPRDTDNLQFGTYAFDIELIKGDVIKKTFAGKLVLTEEATHASNEVIHP